MPIDLFENFSPATVRQFVLSLTKVIDEKKKGVDVGGIKYIARSISADEETTKKLVEELQSKCKDLPVVMGCRKGFKLRKPNSMMHCVYMSYLFSLALRRDRLSGLDNPQSNIQLCTSS